MADTITKEVTQEKVARSVLAASIGNAVEWFDWTVYATFAVFFAAQFFPKGDDSAALLSTFGIFAVGFFMRPIGGWLFGVLADRRGRRGTLTLTIVLMSLGSLLIALLPGYATIGIAAPALLTLARLVQGRYGRRPQLLVFSIGFAILIVPLMTVLNGSFAVLLGVQVAGLLLIAAYTAIAPVLYAEQFPTEVRTVGIGAPYNLTVALFGGTAPYLLTWLGDHKAANLFFWYIAAAAVVSAITFWRMRETRDRTLAGGGAGIDNTAAAAG